MSNDRPAHRPSRRSLIMRVAIEEICRDGDSGELPTVGAVADAAGLTPAAIYYHFPSRADLLIALVEEIHPDVLEVFVKFRSHGLTPVEWSEHFFRNLADWVEAHPYKARFYFLIAPTVPLESVAEVCTRARHEFLTLVSEQVRAGQDESALHWVHSHAIRELITGALEISLVDRETPPRRLPALRRTSAALAGALLTPTP